MSKGDSVGQKNVKLTLYIDADEDWILEGIVRERKRTRRGYSKNEYFRELMRRDPAFLAAKKSDQ